MMEVIFTRRKTANEMDSHHVACFLNEINARGLSMEKRKIGEKLYFLETCKGMTFTPEECVEIVYFFIHRMRTCRYIDDSKPSQD